jgi:hypothetical protein
VFAYLIDGARTVRSPLLYGYTALLTLWISLYDQLPDRRELSPTSESLLELYDELGPAGHVALWTFAAYMLGALLESFILDAIVAYLLRFPKGPDWDEFVESARTAVKRYEEYRVQYPSLQVTENRVAGRHGPQHSVPSQQWGQFLWREVQDRERRRAELQFRMSLALAIVPPVVALVLRGGWIWSWGLLPSVVILIDLGRMQDRTRSYMNERRRESVGRELEQVKLELDSLAVSDDDARRLDLGDEMLGRLLKNESLRRAELSEQLEQLTADTERLRRERDHYFTVSHRVRRKFSKGST